MSKYAGTITIPFEIEASKAEQVEKVVNYVLDRFGEHDFSHLTFNWDEPEWSFVEETPNAGR